MRSGINLDDKVSVIFPNAPEKTVMGDMVIFMLTTDNFIYNAGQVHLKWMKPLAMTDQH